HSASSVVMEALARIHATGRRVTVTCTESRPAREGVEMARHLGAAGIPVRLVIDAAAPALLHQCDAVLLGADTVGTAGVVHKVGTLGLVLAARQYGVPVYVLTTGEKLLPEACGAAPPIPVRDGREVLDPPAPGVTAFNVYFDLTPLQWLSGIFTEEGLLAPPSLPPRLRSLPVHPALRGLWQEPPRS
ncbi:MAG: initiation factor 2B, partial [Armatimonadota bacterium]|nr:initiation factor 2B [Armatimonadota bacterium]